MRVFCLTLFCINGYYCLFGLVVIERVKGSLSLEGGMEKRLPWPIQEIQQKANDPGYDLLAGG